MYDMFYLLPEYLLPVLITFLRSSMTSSIIINYAVINVSFLEFLGSICMADCIIIMHFNISIDNVHQLIEQFSFVNPYGFD